MAEIFSYLDDSEKYIEELPIEKAVESSMAAFSGMCMTDEPVRSATWRFLRAVYDKKIPIVLDVNYRYNLWKSEEDMIRIMRETLPYVTLYKSSEEEACLLAGEIVLDVLKKTGSTDIRAYLRDSGENI